MDNNGLVHAWNKGIHLSRCYQAYQTDEERKIHDALYKKSALEAFVKAVMSPNEANQISKDGSSVRKSNFESPQSILNDRINLRDQVQKRVVRWLQSGALLGLGYERPRRLASALIVIPNELWNGTKMWDKNELSFQSLHFVDIKVVHPKNLYAPVLKSEKQKTGRPTFGPALLDCFSTLVDAGQIDTKQPFSAHIPKIQAWLAAQHPELGAHGKPVSPKTIRSHLSPKFKEIKSSGNGKKL